MGRPSHFHRSPVTKAERKEYQDQLVQELTGKISSLKVTMYQVAKGSGLSYQVVKRVLEGHECKWWVVKAIEKYLHAPKA